MGWVNPCGGEFLATAPTKFENETELRPRNVSLFSSVRYSRFCFDNCLNHKQDNQLIILFVSNFNFSFDLQPKALKPLREALPNFIVRLNGPNMNAIDTSDISEWFKYNSTYSFLHRINATVAAVSIFCYFKNRKINFRFDKIICPS